MLPRKVIIRMCIQQKIKLSYLSTIQTHQMISWMRIRLKSINISGFSDISILMNKRHPHCSISIHRFLVPFICIFAIVHTLLVKSPCVGDIIASLIYREVVSIDSRPRVNFIEHKIVWPKYLLYESRVICTLYFTRIPTIT